MEISTHGIRRDDGNSSNPQEQMLPSVAVVVICYNQARFVVEALDSVKAQAYPNLNLVVLDDCSTDGSVDMIRDWLDRNFPDAIFLAHKTNMGLCRSVNEALANARGKYIRFLAADDRWMPNVLSRQVDVMEAEPGDVAVLYSDAFQIDENGTVLPKMFIETHRSFKEMPEGWIFSTLLEGNFIPMMTSFIRFRCLEVVEGVDESLVAEDWDLWLRISRQFKFRFFTEPSAYYRVLPTSMTRTLADEIIASERRMIVKCLRRGWLVGEKREEAIEAEYLDACDAYRRGLSKRFTEAASAFRRRASMKRALLLLFVAFRLPYRRFEQLIIFLGGLRQRARSLFIRRGVRREPR
jgi:glycosyltransferase involved in cell wall biosynthesis